jgi:hypothetical protein
MVIAAADTRDAGALAGSVENAVIENVRLEGALAVSREAGGSLRAGGVGGHLNNVAVNQVVSRLDISASGNALVHAGGIGGYLAGSSVTESSYAGTLIVLANGHNSTAAGIAGFLLGSETAGPSSARGCAVEATVRLDCSGSVPNQLMFYAGGIAGYAGNGTAGSGSGGVVCEKNRYEGGEVYCGGAGFPYAGGLAGYNYTKSVMRQSYSKGKVTAENPGATGGVSYAGGVAGYNSRESVVEDCYSFMEVWAVSNSRAAQAGGVAGANAAGSTVRRCYAAGAVNARINSASAAGAGNSLGVKSAASSGGIAGAMYFNASSDGTTAASGDIPNRLENCAALNSAVKGFDSNPEGADDSNPEGAANYSVHRIGGDGNEGDMIRSNNYAWDMPMEHWSGSSATTTPDGYDGGNCDKKPARPFYETTLGWDFAAVWAMGGDGYLHFQWEE